MKTLLMTLLLACSANAQLIGQRYGQGTDPIPSLCGSNTTINNPWIAAHGSDHIGHQIIFRCADRQWWCNQYNTYQYFLLVGFGPLTSLVLPTSATNTNPTSILNSVDAITPGVFDTGTGVEYYSAHNIPANPALVGMQLYCQWVMTFRNPQGLPMLMASEGLIITVEQ